MSTLMAIGQTVLGASSGMSYRIAEFLGGGGQGEVYRATAMPPASARTCASAQAESAAIKWYFPRYIQQDVRLRERLERAVTIGAPSDRFLWPAELVASPGSNGFGYAMGLRESRFRSMAELVTRQIEPSLRALATAAYELSNSFLFLHARGLCYRDISFGNVFLDPATGEVRICDNDNVDIDGQPGAIGGTARFMAPELVTGQGAPSTNSDLFSLAVLLFYLLLNHHPLEGAQESAIRCMDLPAMTRLYGAHPVFIFDPQDSSNRPVPGVHDNALAFWPLYPQFVRDLFTRAFSDGLHDAQQGRVRESEWRAAMVHLHDSIYYCSHCGAENFYDSAALRNAGAHIASRSCWSCGHALQLPPRIRISQGPASHVVILSHDTKLFSHHVDQEKSFLFETPIAEVRRHPKRADRWGLANLSGAKWTATTVAGETLVVPPGRSVTLANGVKIQFGPSQGEIRT